MEKEASVDTIVPVEQNKRILDKKPGPLLVLFGKGGDGNIGSVVGLEAQVMALHCK